MVSTLKTIQLPSATYVRSLVAPMTVGLLALGGAIIAAFLTGESAATGGVNGFVETLSGRATDGLSGGFEIGGKQISLAPLGFAFVAGMASAVNPCGFAMLPAYLGLYLGSSGQAEINRTPLYMLANALLVGLTVTAGFVLLFAAIGMAIDQGIRSIVEAFPWVGFSIGVVLALVGSWILGGGKLYVSFAGRAASRVGNPSQVGIRGYFLFGLSYGLASLGCSLPIFLTVVFTTQAADHVLQALGQFLLYALGMGLVILVLTISMALFKRAVVTALRKALPLFQPFSAVFMIAAGSYLAYYWLTIGDLA